MLEKSRAILPATVEKVIKSTLPSEREKAQINVEGADHLYEEIRLENSLTDASGHEVQVKTRYQSRDDEQSRATGRLL